MKRRGQNPKSWKPRLSAGGANRTNLQGVMARYQHQQPEHDSLLILQSRPSGSDLLPTRRINSFQPFQSRLHYPTRSYREWEPPPPPSYLPSSRYSRSPEQRPGRLVPRKGLFQNAKYSELPPPPEIDEERVRHTEEAIRRIIQKSHQSERFSLNADPNYQLRDSIIRQVYEQGVPEHYRGAPQPYEEPLNLQKRPSSSNRRLSHPHTGSSRHHYQNSRFYNTQREKHHSKGDDRRMVSYEEEEYEDYDSDDEEEVFRREEPPRKRAKKHRRVYEEEEEDEEEPQPEPRKRSQKQQPRHQSRQKSQKHMEDRESSSSDEEVNRSNASKNSRTSRTSRASKRSKANPPEKSSSCSQSPVATGPYIRDTIDRTDKLGGFEWKKSIPFMCDERGAALIDRIEAGVKRLPMRDDSQNCYSHIAHMLLARSMKNVEAPAEHRQLAQPQSHLANSTTSWEHVLHTAAHPRSSSDPQEQEPEPESVQTSTSLFRDISRLRNPENVSTLEIDASLFANPRLLDMDKRIEAGWMARKCAKKAKERMPPPLHRSSPVSNDIFKSSDEVITAPSSIKKLSGGFCVSRFEPPEDEDNSDIDESEEITGSNFPANPDISFYDPDPVLSFDPLDIEPSSNEGPAHKTMHINSRYEFTIREKRGKATPMMQEDEELNREFSNSKSSQRYLF